MIYKFEKSKKKKYLLMMILLCMLCAVGLFLFALLMDGFIIYGPEFFLPFILLAVFYVYFIIKTAKRYDTATLEITEDSLTLSWKGRIVTMKFSEIQRISYYPTLFDNHQLLITYGKWKVLTINSFFESFDEITKLLENIKPIEKKSGKIRKVMNILLLFLIFLAFIANIIPSFTFKFIFIPAGIIASIFNIVRYSKSVLNKSAKVVGIVVYSILTFVFLESLLAAVLLKTL